MLELTVRHAGQNLSLELPMPTEVITGELRDIGLWQSLHLITQKKFTLQPINKLGEHFMKLVRPDDTLRTIAMHCREFDVLAGESRQTLEDLVMADRFRDLDHMADYLQHGPAALSHLIRLRHEGRQLDLPASAQELLDFAGGSPRKILLSDVEYVPLNAQGKELLIRLNPYDNLGVANLAGTLVEMPDLAASLGEVVDSARNLLPEPTQSQEPPHVIELKKPDCPLVGQDGNVFNLVGVAARTLREHGLGNQAKEMRERAMDSGSYDQALGVIMEYVNPTSVHDDIEDNEDWYYDEEVYVEPDFGGMGGMA